MSIQIQSIDKLIEAVEAGALTGPKGSPAVTLEMSRIIVAAVGDGPAWFEVVGAHDGSVDDALLLMSGLLPGWWATLRISSRPLAVVGDIEPVSEAHDDMPARALLLAILKAYRIEIEVRQ